MEIERGEVMSEQEFNKIFSKNLQFYLEINEKTQAELAKHVGVSTAAVNQWCKGIKIPRMDKVDKICNFLFIKRSDLIEEHPLDKEKALLSRASTYAVNILNHNPEYSKIITSLKKCDNAELETINALLNTYTELNASGKKKLVERANELKELGYTLKGDIEKMA